MSSDPIDLLPPAAYDEVAAALLKAMVQVSDQVAELIGLLPLHRWTRDAHAAPWAWAVAHDGHVWAHGLVATWERALERVSKHLSR